MNLSDAYQILGVNKILGVNNRRLLTDVKKNITHYHLKLIQINIQINIRVFFMKFVMHMREL